MLSPQEHRIYINSRNTHIKKWDNTVIENLETVASLWRIDAARVLKLYASRTEIISEIGDPTPSGLLRDGWMLTGRYNNKSVKVIIKLHPAEDDCVSIEEYKYVFYLYSMPLNRSHTILPFITHREEKETVEGLQKIFKTIMILGVNAFN